MDLEVIMHYLSFWYVSAIDFIGLWKDDITESKIYTFEADGLTQLYVSRWDCESYSDE